MTGRERGGFTLPHVFCKQGGYDTSLSFFEANQRGLNPLCWFRHKRRGTQSLPHVFNANREGQTFPFVFNANTRGFDPSPFIFDVSREAIGEGFDPLRFFLTQSREGTGVPLPACFNYILYVFTLLLT